MIRVNKHLISRIFIWILASLALCSITLIYTGRIADSSAYVGLLEEFNALGQRTKLATAIFKLLPFYGNLTLSIITVVLISSITIFLSLSKYMNKANLPDWYLILYLPSLLLYASTPTKEFLFFIPSLIYIVIECEHLIKNPRENDYTLIKNIVKGILLTFMVQIRGLLASPYVLVATFIFLFKTFNLKFFRIRNLNFTVLILYSLIICLTLLIIVDKDFLINNLTILNKQFFTKSVLSSSFDFNLMNNLYNPFNFIKIQLLAAFPTIKEVIQKPYALLILYESLIFFYSFFKVWTKLFSIISEDNKAKFCFSIIFIVINCCYFLIYGMIGYLNLGSYQRFRTNLIPIMLFFPLIIENIIYRNKIEFNSLQKNNY